MSTFSNLKKTYDDFYSPAFKIEVGGSEIPPEMPIGNLIVDLSMGITAGACRFTALNPFKKETRQINSDFLDLLGVGKKVKVSLGYGSTLKPVFYGYIAELGMRWSESLQISVTCMDARALMRESRSDIAYEGKNTTAIVNEILDNYSALISSHDVSMPELVQNVNITKLTDDLSFICGEAERRGIDFILDVDKLTLKSASPEICLTLDWEEYELSFDMGYLKTEYTLRGYDAENLKTHEKKGKAEQSGTQSNLITVKKTLPVEMSVSADAVETILNGKIKESVRSSFKGRIECAGLPEIKPGQLVELTNTPLSKLGLGSKFIVTAVRHVMEESGFMSSVTIGGTA